jgi:hypothetical protein
LLAGLPSLAECHSPPPPTLLLLLWVLTYPATAVPANFYYRREAFVVPFLTGTVPAWSDACFSPVQWDSPPKCDGDQGWQVVCSTATDAEGWIYGTTFDHLQYERPGGRASKRVNDRVRSRLWRRVQQQVRLRHMCAVAHKYTATSLKKVM